jgi:phosphoribosylamine--glycine ligase
MSEPQRQILILGSGAREHSIADAILRFDSARRVVVAPGNGGISGAGLSSQAVDLGNHAQVIALAQSLAAELVIVGPEAPLCDGIVDSLEAAGFAVFGPSKAAAQLEASKAFLKSFAARHRIPTAPFEIVTSFAEAEAAILRRGAPIVVKASGLCSGKGVVVATTVEEALAAAKSMLVDRIFGAAADEVVLEDCLPGTEASVFALSDGERFLVLPPFRDHKRLLDDDRGPNTGGMGVVGPVEELSAETLSRITSEIIEPTLAGMRKEGAPFRGVLFAGVMIDADGVPSLLEHNVRFGDPECEALMSLLEGDVLGALAGCATRNLNPGLLSIPKGRHAAVVILAAEGYPMNPRSGDPIEGLEQAERLGAKVFHAGTARSGEGLVTKGGRVLAVTACGSSREAAREVAYAAADAIQFQGKQLRRDIGAR